MSDLPIQPDEEAVTVSDIPEHMLSGFESDLSVVNENAPMLDIGDESESKYLI